MPTPSHIKDLLPDPSNRRKHTPRNIGMITDALQAVGAGRSIVIDENSEVIAGNGVVEAAAVAGITKVQIVDADGDTLIAVRRKNLTPEQKRQMAMFDNRTAETAEWDLDQLRDDHNAGLDLSQFFSDKELSALLGLSDDEDHTVQPIKIERPAEIVWVLLAIPMKKWAHHVETVEQIAADCDFSASVIRPKGTDAEAD